MLKSSSTIKFSSHAIQRMFEREFQKDSVVDAVRNGEIIQEYPNDKPYPSYLLLAIINKEPIHIIAAFNENGNEVYVVTVYSPDKKIWSDDFRQRRK